MSVNTVTFVAPNLAWGKARGGSIPRQWGCDRRATKPQAKFGATLRAAVLFGPGGVARSLPDPRGICSGARAEAPRAVPGPKTPRRKRHRIYAHDHFGLMQRRRAGGRRSGGTVKMRASGTPGKGRIQETRKGAR